MADKPEFLEMEGSGHDIVMSEEETGDKGKGKRKESGELSSGRGRVFAVKLRQLSLQSSWYSGRGT